MNTPATRECPCCAEIIPARARVCPRCRQWLSWRSLRHPLVSLGMMVAIMLGVGGLFLRYLERRLAPRPFYAETPEALSVLESRWNWVATEKGPRIYLTGLLTHHSPQAWKDPEFECRFFDATGRLIDVGHRTSFQTVLAGADSGFRLVVEPRHPREAYHSHRVRVIHVRNPRAFF